MKARVIIGANYGDEGKGAVVATYTKNSNDVLNILTNGGAQRGHSILTREGSMTFQHFGSGTYYGADNYYSRFFILNPMQFVNEYNSLLVKPNIIYRDWRCLWTTPYDSMANLIEENLRKRKASCCMGIWNTIKRSLDTGFLSFDVFMTSNKQKEYLNEVKNYYEQLIDIPQKFKSTWNSKGLVLHFLKDCVYMYEHTEIAYLNKLKYNNLIFENGQGLLLCDTGKDTFDTTPSNTGCQYAIQLLKENNLNPDISLHYVTRPYLTRHGDGEMLNEDAKSNISKNIQEDRTNHFNEYQGQFRYGKLDTQSLYDRIKLDCKDFNFELELTHCDEMDRISEFKKIFDKVNIYKSPLV